MYENPEDTLIVEGNHGLKIGGPSRPMAGGWWKIADKKKSIGYILVENKL